MAKTTTTRPRKLSSVPPMPTQPPTSMMSSMSTMSNDERGRMIAERAYFLAAERGFAPGAELDDWLAAEREIDQSITRA